MLRFTCVRGLTTNLLVGGLGVENKADCPTGSLYVSMLLDFVWLGHRIRLCVKTRPACELEQQRKDVSATFLLVSLKDNC
jgi:hypothetical protein